MDNNKSLQEITAEQLVRNYPLDLLELIVNKGRERLAKENERTIIITYNMDKLVIEDDVDVPISENKNQLIHVIDFIIDMKLFDDFNDRDLLSLVRDVNEYHRQLGIENQNITKKNYLSELKTMLLNMKFYPLIDMKNYLLSICGNLTAYFNGFDEGLIFDFDDSKNMCELLSVHHGKNYEKYFIMENCHKYDYVAIYLDRHREYSTCEIDNDINTMNLHGDDDDILQYAYQVL